MKTAKAKKLKKVTPKRATVKITVKKSGKKLSKSDPDFYKKLGEISAKKRKLPKSFFSKMAEKSHGPDSNRDGYHGGRKKADS